MRIPRVISRFPYFFVGTFIEVFLLHSTGWVFLRFLVETFIEALRSVILGGAYGSSFPFPFGGALNKTDQYPLKVTAEPLVLYLEV